MPNFTRPTQLLSGTPPRQGLSRQQVEKPGYLMNLCFGWIGCAWIKHLSSLSLYYFHLLLSISLPCVTQLYSRQWLKCGVPAEQQQWNNFIFSSLDEPLAVLMEALNNMVWINQLVFCCYRWWVLVREVFRLRWSTWFSQFQKVRLQSNIAL